MTKFIFVVCVVFINYLNSDKKIRVSALTIVKRITMSPKTIQQKKKRLPETCIAQFLIKMCFY